MRRWWGIGILVALLLPGSGAEAVRAQEVHVLVVVGIGGEARYRTSFHEAALATLDGLRERFGIPAERMTYLGERVEVALRFTAHRGLFLLHCHNLEHEDHGMMMNFLVE